MEAHRTPQIPFDVFLNSTKLNQKGDEKVNE